MARTVLSTLNTFLLFCPICQQYHLLISLILQMRKVSLREVKKLVQVHTAYNSRAGI